MSNIKEIRSSASAYATQSYLALMLFAFTLFTGTDGYILLNAKKYWFFAAATAAWLAVLLVCAVARRARPRPDALSALVLLFMAASVVSTLLSPYATLVSASTGRYDGLSTYLLYGAMLLALRRCARPCEYLLYIFAAAYLVCALSALLQLAGLDPLRLYPNGLRFRDPFVQETGKFLGTTGNVDTFSALTCLAVPLFAAAAVFTRARRRLLLLVPAAVGIVVLLREPVDSGILALGAAALPLLPLALTKTLAPQRKRRVLTRLYYAEALLVAALLMYVYFAVPNSTTLRELHSLLHGEADGSFGSMRLEIWSAALRVVGEHPLFGVGADSLANYLGVSAARYSEVFGRLITAVADNAHNEYLNLAASLGLAAAVPAFAALALIFACALRRLRERPSLKILLPAMVCYLIQAFFNIGLCIVTPLFVILLGITAHEACATQSPPPPSCG